MGVSFLSKVSEFFGLDSEEDEFDRYSDDLNDDDQESGYDQQINSFRQNQSKGFTGSNRLAKGNHYVGSTKASFDHQNKINRKNDGNHNNIIPFPKCNSSAFQGNQRRTMNKSNSKNRHNFSLVNPKLTLPKIVIKEPRVYSDALEIAKLLIKNEAVLINFHLMEERAAGRVIDFLTGTVYAIDGDIQRVGNEIFLLTANNMEIDGDIARSLLNSGQFDKM